MNEEIKQTLVETIKRSVIVMMKNIWSVADLALVLDVSESRIRHLARDRSFPSYKQGGRLFFKREEIEAWLTAHRTASQAEIDSQAATYCATRRIR